MIKPTAGKMPPEVRAACETILTFTRKLAESNAIMNEDDLETEGATVPVMTGQMALSAALQCVLSVARDDGIKGVDIIAGFAVALGVQFADAKPDLLEIALKMFGGSFRRAAAHGTSVEPQN